MKRTFSGLLLLSLVLAFMEASALEVPYLSGRVVDNAQILSPEAVSSITETLKAHEELTTNQVVVLTIPSLMGESIEDFAYRVFNAWGLGQESKDNGILLIVVPNDRSMRIEVGYGLEATVTDLHAHRIIQNIIAPRFREEDYDGGIGEGVQALINIMEGGELPDELTEEESAGSFLSGLSSMEDTGLSLGERILMGAFIFGIIGLFTLLGILTPGAGWFIYLFLIPFWATFPIVVLGTKGTFICFISYLVLFPAIKLSLKNMKWYKRVQKDLRTTGTTSVGGFAFSTGSSGSSGGSGRSWSSGGGGFSGGGGRSGGGGSSGGW